MGLFIVLTFCSVYTHCGWQVYASRFSFVPFNTWSYVSVSYEILKMNLKKNPYRTTYIWHEELFLCYDAEIKVSESFFFCSTLHFVKTLFDDKVFCIHFQRHKMFIKLYRQLIAKHQSLVKDIMYDTDWAIKKGGHQLNCFYLNTRLME